MSRPEPNVHTVVLHKRSLDNIDNPEAQIVLNLDHRVESISAMLRDSVRKGAYHLNGLQTRRR